MTDLSELTNLDEYYIIKKFNNGWLMGSVLRNESLFIPQKDLIRMGYLEGPIENNKPILVKPGIIVVPTEDQRPSKSRADQNLNWRRTK